MQSSQHDASNNAGLRMTVATSAKGQPLPQYSAATSLGFNRMDSFALPSGMHVLLQEFNLAEQVQVPFNYETNPFFFFGFVLHGSGGVLGEGGRDWLDGPRTGPFCMLFTFEGDGTWQCEPSDHVQNLRIGMSREVMHSLLGDAMASLPKACQDSGHVPQGMALPGIMTPSMVMSMHQAMQTPCSLAHSTFLLESKALDLLVAFLENAPACALKPFYDASTYISPDKREILHAARDILRTECDAPPSVAALSRRVGMNACSLKKLFKQHFGATLYGFVRDERMRQAKALLEQGLSVSETATRLGYVNYGYFAGVFRRYYGYSPSSFKGRSK